MVAVCLFNGERWSIFILLMTCSFPYNESMIMAGIHCNLSLVTQKNCQLIWFLFYILRVSLLFSYAIKYTRWKRDDNDNDAITHAQIKVALALREMRCIWHGSAVCTIYTFVCGVFWYIVVIVICAKHFHHSIECVYIYNNNKAHTHKTCEKLNGWNNLQQLAYNHA